MLVDCLIGGLSNNAEDVVLAHDQVIFIVDFDFGAAVFRDQHLVAFLHREIDFLSFLIDFPGAESDDLPLLWFFLGGIGDDDPAFFYFLLFERLHQHPVSERFYVNSCHRLFRFLLGLLLSRWPRVFRGHRQIVFQRTARDIAASDTDALQFSCSRFTIFESRFTDYFFLSSSTTSNSASTTSPPLRLPALSSAPPPGWA